MQIGRGVSKRVFRPTSSNTMFERAQVQLEGHAASHAERYNSALNVDGPNVIVWTNTGGAIPCSCRAVNASSVDADLTPLFDEGETPTETKVVIGKKGFIEGDTREAKATLITGTRKPLVAFERRPNRLADLTAKDNIRSSNLDEFIASGEYNDDDILDALSSEEGGSGSLTDSADPFNLFADKIIECPVCLGTGFIDAWQPHGGSRMVFDTSNVYNFFCEECAIDDSTNPTIVTVQPGQSIQWTAKFPLVWDELIRINVYNGTHLIHPDWYDFTWAIPRMALSGNMSVDEMTSGLFDVDSNVSLQLYAKEEFPFTHAEVIFMFAPLVRAQIPEMPQAYEDEFSDWSASVSFELPVGVTASEGDYVTEAKYNRIWKINSVNRKQTAGNTVFGVSVDVRALHRFEKIFYQLSVFRNEPYGLIGCKYP